MMINTTVKRASLAFLLAVLVTLLVLPVTAGAQETEDPYTTNPTDPPTTDVAGTSVVNDPGTEVAGEQVTNELPFTGGDTTVLAAIGVGLVAAGAVLVVTRRRRSDSLA